MNKHSPANRFPWSRLRTPAIVVTAAAAIVAVVALALGPVGVVGAGPESERAPTGTVIAPRDPVSQWRTDIDLAQAAYATLGGGCFWCTEAVYELTPGVLDVISGYAGGTTANPTYQQVIGGRTGHAEVIQIAYDPQQVSYEDLLEVFWHAHDPTTKDRQGADVGPQYRSIILYHDDDQREIAAESLQRADASGRYFDPIVTEIVALESFFPAESYHQDYFAKNPNAAYCRLVIAPKLDGLDEKGFIEWPQRQGNR